MTEEAVAPGVAMDVAAVEAGKEFKLEWSAGEVVVWWRKWFKLAGHKRLGRFLASLGK